MVDTLSLQVELGKYTELSYGADVCSPKQRWRGGLGPPFHYPEVLNRIMAAYQLVLKWLVYGQEVRNVLNYQLTDTSDTGLQALADEVKTLFTSEANSFHVAASLYGIDYYDLDQARPRPARPFSFTGGPFVGTSSFDGVASQTACLIRWLGGQPYKPNRGRMYLPGITAPSIDDGTGLWTATFQTGFNTFMDQFISIDYNTTENASLYIMRLGADGIPTVENNVVGSVVVSAPATQRKRRIGSGA